MDRLVSGFLVLGAAAAVVVACSSNGRSSFGNGDDADAGGSGGAFQNSPTPLDGGDPYANDPPQPWCGTMSGKPPPPTPTGTEQCPSDKNKPGCACDTVGATAACWTGLRANRGLGVCKDGTTTCQRIDETTFGWGPCNGEVLPTSGAKEGSNACKCFSAGQWKIDNVVPCTIPYPDGSIYITSTTLDATGKPQCPPIADGSTPPPAKPAGSWSNSTITADCAGTFDLCYAIKAGDVTKPAPSDCTIAKVCVKTDYLAENVAQTLPPLDSWVSADPACAAQMHATGGYGEMTVNGVSVHCDKVDDGAGNPYVFSRLGYCPDDCATNPSAPGCQSCQNGGSGQF